MKYAVNLGLVAALALAACAKKEVTVPESEAYCVQDTTQTDRANWAEYDIVNTRTQQLITSISGHFNFNNQTGSLDTNILRSFEEFDDYVDRMAGTCTIETDQGIYKYRLLDKAPVADTGMTQSNIRL